MSPEDQDTRETVLEHWQSDKEDFEIFLTEEKFLVLAWVMLRTTEQETARDLESLPPYILPGEPEVHLQAMKDIATRLRPNWEAEYKAYQEE